MTAAVTVLLADDHAMFREGLRFVLGQEPGLTVVGEAATGEQALSLAAELDPDQVPDRRQAMLRSRAAGGRATGPTR
ncbi:response regulator [Blastococcus saxobsidens]|uniref:Two component transcriptional regulator, LuxR family n=1 Tax=Blastococcus saxobsidens (strain DD2) TaxID=1146883 RepID=H6RKR2_BLASD|nr:response regulator [Blastococcus saxobsidens]CCG03678.1 Two component transcriptional regulator, LuxR family [Blastococcus saxobsidens DD2]